MLSIRQSLRTFKSIPFVKKLEEIQKIVFSDKYLLLTNLGISLSLSSFGDILEQKYERYSGQLSKWDKKRTMHMGISGVSVGFLCHFWYKYLDSRLPGTNLRVVLKKVMLDQLICSPVYISIFFATLGLLEKSTWEETLSELKSKAWKLYVAEWTVWPVAQIINFHFVPPKYRILYDNSISLGYDIFTSRIKYQQIDDNDTNDEKKDKTK